MPGEVDRRQQHHEERARNAPPAAMTSASAAAQPLGPQVRRQCKFRETSDAFEERISSNLRFLQGKFTQTSLVTSSLCEPHLLVEDYVKPQKQHRGAFMAAVDPCRAVDSPRLCRRHSALLLQGSDCDCVLSWSAYCHEFFSLAPPSFSVAPAPAQVPLVSKVRRGKGCASLRKCGGTDLLQTGSPPSP